MLRLSMERVIAGAVLIAAVGLCGISFGIPPIYGTLSIKNGHFVNAAGHNIQLKGMSMYGWTNACGYAFYNDSCIKHLVQDWKCTVIRMPYQTDNSIPMANINAVIQACINYGVYCIVDWHDGSAQASAANASAFFTTVATQWHTYPNVMYEPWNEPNGNGGPPGPTS